MKFTLTSHAQTVIRARNIRMEWITETLSDPIRTHPDPEDATATHALRAIADHGNRVLRVIYNHTTDPPQIVTVYFDRALKGKL